MISTQQIYAHTNARLDAGVVSQVRSKPSIFVRAFCLSRATRFILENGRVFVVSFENPKQNLNS
jgi:hypothetical protein